MSCRYGLIFTFFVFFAAVLTGCGSGIQTGTLDSKFTGVESGVAISPTAVKLNWKAIDGVTEYQVFEASQSAALQKTVFTSVTIESLQPDTEYVFKVIGISGSDRDGVDKEVRVRTWPRFEGVQAIAAGGDGKSFQITWEYSEKPINYLIYVSTTAIPTAATTNNWATVTAISSQKLYLLQDLQPSTTYYVVVQAQYRTEEFERNTKSVSMRSGTTFKTPLITMPKISIGSLPYIVVDPQIDATHSRSGFRSQAYWKGNPVSDPLTGKGTLTFLGSAGLPIGKVDGISLKVEYGAGASLESQTIDGLVTYIKGISDQVEIPAADSVPQGASYFGKVLARGDFNCDGGMDLAVGVPDISLAQYGITVPASGAVFVYYSKPVGDRFVLQTSPAPRPDPVVPGRDPQIILFNDLPSGTAFGTSLAAGNLNGDVGGGGPCDDLAVGAPGYRDTTTPFGSTYGAAFVFFGSENGLHAMSQVKDIPRNIETCDGRAQGATCVAAMITPDPSLIPSDAVGGAYTPYGSIFGGSYWNFGKSMAFIGDFDANGYEDLAIGAPNAPFAGKIPGYTTNNGYILNVGFVNIYPGSKFGLGKEAYFHGGVTSNLRAIPIFPPIPEDGMLFGASIAGGADIDGKYPIKYAGSLVGGADMVIGAPNFKYKDYRRNPLTATNPSNYGTTSDKGVVQPRGGAGTTPAPWIPSGTKDMANCTNYYGWPQAGTSCAQVEVGTAFVYYGNGSLTQMVADEATSTRATWLNCSARSLPATLHFSCLNDQKSFDQLFPRDPKARHFGSSVAVIGDPSHFMPGTNLAYSPGWDGSPISTPAEGADSSHLGAPYLYYSDTNQDGYADIAVMAADASVGTNSSVGTVNLFFGNDFNLHLFGGADFFNVSGLGTPIPSADYFVNVPQCTVFNVLGAKAACRPVVLSSGSLSANAGLGRYQSSVSVADVTGDGVKDLIVGAPGESTVGSGSGAVLVFPSLSQAATSGAGGGLTSSYKKLYTIQTSAGDQLGFSVTAGDFNGDYYSYQPDLLNQATKRPLADVFGGAPFDGSKAPAVGTVAGFLSNDFPLPSVMNTSSDGAGHELILNETIASFQNYGLGETTIIGDVNGDGYEDAASKVLSYSTSGITTVDAVIYFGSPLGLITTSFCATHLTQVFKTTQPVSACNPSVTPTLGITNGDVNLPQKIPHPASLPPTWYVRAIRAGDVNHDGYGDVLFISNAGSGGGTMTLFFGARGGLLNVVDPTYAPSIGDPQIVTQKIPFSLSETPFDGENGIGGILIRDMITVGDFNGDHFMDIAIGVPTASSPSMNMDVASGGDGKNHYLATETPAGPTAIGGGWNCSRPTTDEACASGQPIAYHGMVYVMYGSKKGYQTPAVSGLGNTSGDWNSLSDAGILDLMDTERSDASVKPCLTASDPLNPSSDTAATCYMTYMRNPVFENITGGYYKLGQGFGMSVNSLKVDTDSFDDLLVGAPLYSDIACFAAGSHPYSYGRIWAFYGSSKGLVASARTDYYNPDRTGSCPTTPDTDPATGIMPGTKLRALAPFLANPSENGGGGSSNVRAFGRYMASAGDVNGDGVEDFLVATPQEKLSVDGVTTQTPGAFYLFYGPLCPADNDAVASQTWQSDYSASNPQPYLNTQTFMQGNAPAWVSISNQISIPVNESSPCKVTSKAMKPLPLKFTIKGATTEQYGIGMSSARMGKGDFNGDGVDDILVGSSKVNDTVNLVDGVGGGVILFGHPNGLMVGDYPTQSLSQGPVADSFRPLTLLPKKIEKDAQYFRGNITVGDVNNDKTADYMVTSRQFSGYGAIKGIWIGTFFVFY